MVTASDELTTKQIKKAGLVRRVANLIVFFLVALYIGCSPAGFAAAFEFMPVKATGYEPEKAGVDREDIFFRSKNGAKLHAWYFKAPGATKTVLLHHGNGGNLASYLGTAHCLYSAGANVFVYDYEGFGLSEGQPTNANVCEDAEAAYRYVMDNRLAAPNHLIEGGLSLGTGVACRMAGEHPCEGMILVSPYKSFEEVAKAYLPFLRIYPSFLFPQPDLGAGRIFVEHKIPLLMIHAVHDPLIPVAQADEIYREAQGPKVYYRIPEGACVHLGSLGEGAVGICKAFLEGPGQTGR